MDPAFGYGRNTRTMSGPTTSSRTQRATDAKYRMLNIIDEFTRKCLVIQINGKLNSTDLIDALSDLFALRGIPGHRHRPAIDSSRSCFLGCFWRSMVGLQIRSACERRTENITIFSYE